jgi:TonB family protein
MTAHALATHLWAPQHTLELPSRAVLASIFNLRRPSEPHERRMTFALLCSAAFHALVASTIALIWALTPVTESPAGSEHPVVRAVLAERPSAPDFAEVVLLPLPPVDAAPAPLASLDPAPHMPPRATHSAPQAVSAPVAGPIAGADPNGSVTVGMLDASTVRQGPAARLAERFPRADKLPRVLGTPIVAYPPAARHAQASGRVSAVLELDERGKVTQSVLVPEHPLFGAAVTEALNEMRFAPAEVASKPVPYWAVVEFVFTIGPSTTAAAPAREGAPVQRVAIPAEPSGN